MVGILDRINIIKLLVKIVLPIIIVRDKIKQNKGRINPKIQFFFFDNKICKNILPINNGIIAAINIIISKNIILFIFLLFMPSLKDMLHYIILSLVYSSLLIHPDWYS